MGYFKNRRVKKMVHQLLHEARHARHMREDITESDLIRRLTEAEDGLKAAFRDGDDARIETAAEEVASLVQKVYPTHRSPRLRENVEIIVVAVSVAMAFRTFFIQPFRIPTGSMQPTLYGITHADQNGKTAMDRFPLNIVSFLVFGETYKEITAKASGVVTYHNEHAGNAPVFRIAGVPHRIPMDMPRRFQVGRTQVKKGDVIASGRKKMGDHIFVNRLKYNFTPPERGDIFVFSTRGIKHPDIRPDNYYIKRLVGLPGESISVDPPYLYADGQKVTEPDVFRRQAEGEGYPGYGLVGNVPTPAYLRTARDTIDLSPEEYLPFGDNTHHSLDGRFFGGVNRRTVIGPAFMVYWPFGRNWGLVE